MQSKIFQAFICYNFDDHGLQLMKTPKLELWNIVERFSQP